MAEVPYTQLPRHLATEIVEMDGREIAFEAVRLSKAEACVDSLVAECGNPTWNKRAALLATGKLKGAKGFDSAVYVVTPASRLVSKVGITTNPIKRMEALQCGSHEQLVMTHTFWLPRKAAIGVEKLTLRVLGRLGARLMSEWCNYSPEEAAAAIAAVATQGAFALATPQMYVANYYRAVNAVKGGVCEDSYAYACSPEKMLMAKREHLGVDL
jgi:hypothetical protein